MNFNSPVFEKVWRLRNLVDAWKRHDHQCRRLLYFQGPQLYKPFLKCERGRNKRIDTAYTHTTYKTEYGGSRGQWQRTVVDQRFEMTKVEFTNLNITVYTMDGIKFHSNPAALLNGEHQWINDPTNLMKQPRKIFEKYGGITCNLDYVTRMDKEQGWREFKGWGKATVSLVSDATLLFGLVARAVGAAGRSGVKIVGHIAGGVTYTWSGVDSVDKLSSEEYDSFMSFMSAVGREALGYVPIYGTYADVKQALNTAGYTVTFY